MTNLVAFAILTAACTGCECRAGRGMPRPYNARLAALQHFPLSMFHEKNPGPASGTFFLNLPFKYSNFQFRRQGLLCAPAVHDGLHRVLQEARHLRRAAADEGPRVEHLLQLLPAQREQRVRRDAVEQVVLISLELDEVMNVSDRILVMYEGEIVGEFDPKKVTVEELGLYMAGSKRKETKSNE